MSSPKANSPAATGAEEAARPTWRQEVLQPLPWFLISFGTSQLVEFLAQKTGAISPASIAKLAALNDAFARGVAAVQPWRGAALFWQKLTGNWPPDMAPMGIPFFLLGRSFGGGLEVILGMLADPKTAVPSVIGYGLGLLLTWRLFGGGREGLNPLIGVLGTIFFGGVTLAVLQPVMLGASALAGAVLGTVSAGVAVLLSLPLALAGSILKHLGQTLVDTGLQKGILGRATLVEPAEAPASEEPAAGGGPAVHTKTEPGRNVERASGAARAKRLYPWGAALLGSGMLGTLLGLDKSHIFLVIALCWAGVVLIFVAWRLEAGDGKPGSDK